MLGRDSRTLSKLFEEVVELPDECNQTLVKTKDIIVNPQKKFIVGLRY